VYTFTKSRFYIFQGVDLREYAKQIENDLAKVENGSIEDC